VQRILQQQDWPTMQMLQQVFGRQLERLQGVQVLSRWMPGYAPTAVSATSSSRFCCCSMLPGVRLQEL
jgi:hypothetical protein